MKAPIILFVCVTSFIGLLASPIAQAFEFGALGGYDGPTLTSNGGNSSGSNFTIGAFMSTTLLPSFQLEIGLMFLPRKISQNSGTTFLGNPITTTQDILYKYLQIPVLLRFDALPVLSVGAGAYFAHGFDNIITTQSTSGTPLATNYASYADVNQAQNDSGLMASIRLNFNIAPTIGLMADVRYLYGLTNLDNSGADSNKWRDLQILGGVGVGF